MDFDFVELEEKNLLEFYNSVNIKHERFNKCAEIKFYISPLPKADLIVRQWVNSSNQYACNKMFFLLKVSNIGPNTAKNAKLIHIIEPLKDVKISSIITSQGNYSYDKGEFIWNLGDILKDKSAVAIISAIPIKIGTYTSLAVVKGSEFDPNLLNNFSCTRYSTVPYISEDDLILCLIILLLLYSCA
jgi:Domain of unknown function DUF11